MRYIWGIRPFIDATGTLRPTPMERYAAERARAEEWPLDEEEPPGFKAEGSSCCDFAGRPGQAPST